MNASAHVAPLSQLERLSRLGATGEFICASGPEEIHVYLQQGRIAWATCSAHPFEFARYIKEHSQIDDDTLRDVLTECRRQRLPFGETLVAWDLLGWDDIRAALRHQIRLTFEQLAALVDAQTMFLERRKFAEYNSRLTLELDSLALTPGAPPRGERPDEISDAPAPTPPLEEPPPEQRPAAEAEALPGGSADAIVDESAAAPAAAAVATPAPEPQPAGSQLPGRARLVREAIRGAIRVELRRGGRLIEAAPPGALASCVPPALTASTLDDGADFVALRSPRGTLLGARSQADGSDVWCALGADANYGNALTMLRSLGLLGADAPRRAQGPWRAALAWEIGDLRSGAGAELRLVFDGHQILAAVLLGADGLPRAGVARVEIERDGWLNLLARRAAIFAIPDLVLLDDDDGPDLAPLGFSIRMTVIGERGVWCFGADLPGGETLWVLTDRASLQGIGWACLTTLIRSVGRSVERGESTAGAGAP